MNIAPYLFVHTIQSEVVKAAKFVPPAWKCGNASMEPPTKRHLLEENLHGHDHAALDHSHHHDHEHLTADGIDISKIKNGLRDSKLRLGKRRELQTATGYKFQVDMYIEVDFDLCARHGEACTNGVGPKTLNYINVLFAGANTVYEVSSVGIFACEMDVRCAIIFANLSSCGMLPRSQFNRRKSIPT